jgi:hypothetical protein
MHTKALNGHRRRAIIELFTQLGERLADLLDGDAPATHAASQREPRPVRRRRARLPPRQMGPVDEVTSAAAERALRERGFDVKRR